MRTARTIQRATEPVVTYTLIAICVLVYLVEGSSGASITGTAASGSVLQKGSLYGPDIAHKHEYYRLLTSGFLHLDFEHILFNMIFLFFVGRMLEPAIGRLNFAAVYFASLFAGSLGALVFQPLIPSVGASGAEFGLLAALIVVAHDRRIPIWSSGLGITLVINIVFSLSVPGISVGAHAGGLAAGFICGWAVVRLGERREMKWAALGVCVLVAAVSIAGAIAVADAGGAGLTPSGLTI